MESDQEKTMTLKLLLPRVMSMEGGIITLSRNMLIRDLLSVEFNGCKGHFLTSDAEGRKILGKPYQKLGDCVSDGQKVYITYIKNSDGTWTNMIEPSDKGCKICGIHVLEMKIIKGKQVIIHVFQCYSGLEIYCDPCFKKFRTGLRYSCWSCGTEGLKETTERQLTKVGVHVTYKVSNIQCPGACKDSEQHLSRECQSCGIPIFKRLKCGRCKGVLYCSIDCQAPGHGPNTDLNVS